MAVSVTGASEDPMVDPNVIPLVDVMLVLLIIMIITVPVMTQAVKIDLPKQFNEPTVTTPENINLSIDFDGSIYWNDTNIARRDLISQVLQEAVKDPQPEVHIRADVRARYEYIADTLADLQHGGMRKVGFIAEPPLGK
ncbi:MAG: biopolymer transporter ExbD [Gammaproteobacteria bacterium]|nr:MAG: biopolymer transporter ExbD [Gammaproteobacteria bacterium]